MRAAYLEHLKRGDVVYMLSQRNTVLLSEFNGRVTHFPPHIMVAAPFATSSAVGGQNGAAFIIHGGEPGALIMIAAAR
jgi:hypothetical protein